jgi:hypothetical protein
VAAALSDSSLNGTNAVAMPWEQTEPVAAGAPVDQQPPASEGGSSSEATEPITPLVSVEPSLEVIRQDVSLNQAPAEPQAQLSAEPDHRILPDSSALRGPTPETVQPADQPGVPVPEVPVVDSVLTGEAEFSLPTVAEVPPVMIEVLTEGSGHPIAEAPLRPAPMPWDQIEDGVAVSPPAPDQEEPVRAEGLSDSSREAELRAEPVAESTSSTMELLAQTSSELIAEAPLTPAPMPWDQVEDVAVEIPPPTDMSARAPAEVASVSPMEVEVPLVPLDTASPTLQILTKASHHPISSAPTSPAPMPWDQVEETTSTILPITEPRPEVEGAGAGNAIEPVATNHRDDAASPTQQSPASPPAPEIISGGLSWEDILAAVDAMQASSAPAESASSIGNTPSAGIVVPEETVTSIVGASDIHETDSLLTDSPVSEPWVGGTVEVPPLSAPMPWEQIEVDDVPILRQEPEPEFGPLSFDSVGDAQDATVVMPDGSVTVSEAETPPEVTAAASVLQAEPIPASELRILSPDDSIETGKHPIHIPVEAREPIDEQAQETLAESEYRLRATIDQPSDYSLRLAGSESARLLGSNEPPSAPAETVTEFAIETSYDEPPISPQQAVLPDLPVPIAESTAEVSLKSAPQVDEPVNEALVAEVAPLLIGEDTVEALDNLAAPSRLVDHPMQQAEPERTAAPDALVQDPSPAPIVVQSPKMDQGHVSTSQEEVDEAAGSAVGEAMVPVTESSSSPLLPASEALLPQPVTAVNDPAGEDLVLGPVESAQVTVSTTAAEAVEGPDDSNVTVDVLRTLPAESAVQTPASREGLQILWDDAPSAPASSASTGNMLTRWLKRPAAVAPVEASEPNPSTAVPDELPISVAPLAADRQIGTPVVADQPVDQSSGERPVSVEEPVVRPKPQPAADPIWRRLGRAVSSLVGAGVSTTRSLVLLALTLVGLALFLIAGAVGGIAVTWLILEEQPNSAYRSVTSAPQRTLEGSGKNGYLLLLGFDAAVAQDPVQAGMERRVAGIDRIFSHTCLAGEGSGSGTQQGASAEVMGKWARTADPAAQMRLEASGVKSWVSQADVSMSRYRQWLTKPFEDWGYGEAISPNCGLILYAHRLYVAEGFAQDVEAGVARLETDLTAWRTVLGQAKTLPIKMLASDALNDDIMVLGGLLLRPELEERLVSRLAKLARPLDHDEQSVRWPMQSQFVLAIKTLDEAIKQEQSNELPFYGSVAAALPLPKQRRWNAYAEYYEAAGKAAGEDRYSDLPKQSQFVHAPPYGLGDLFVNPIESLVGLDPLPAWETYAGRVMETDARLRLASLQAWLRRTSAEQDLMTRIAKAGQGLYDPFTGYPMLVNLKKGVLYSVGRDLKDNEAQERFDLVVQIPPTAWVGGKRSADLSKTK